MNAQVLSERPVVQPPTALTPPPAGIDAFADSAATVPVPLAQQPRAAAPHRADPEPLRRAAVEAVSLLFHSILTEERIPTGIRLWFARLQIPVLRVAAGDPDGFVAPRHPARRLIDRLGACAMGFDNAACLAGEAALEKEIKRVVQVVEAFPETGKAVFEMVLTEFERFLKRYDQQDGKRHDVSLLQQLDQRETLAVQYTIELRRVVEDISVHESARNFLFQVWADVMAMTAIRSGECSQEMLDLKHAAADLVRLAYLHAPIEQCVEGARRLPRLLRKLRDGMASAGLPVHAQDEHICTLNDALALSYISKAAAFAWCRRPGRPATKLNLLPNASQGAGPSFD